MRNFGRYFPVRLNAATAGAGNVTFGQNSRFFLGKTGFCAELHEQQQKRKNGSFVKAGNDNLKKKLKKIKKLEIFPEMKCFF